MAIVSVKIKVQVHHPDDKTKLQCNSQNTFAAKLQWY